MRKTKFVSGLSFGAVLGLSLLGSPSFAGTDPLLTVAAFHQAMQQGDKNAVLAKLRDDVLIYESGHVERSRREYGEHHLSADIAFSQAVKRKVLKTDSAINGALAVVTQETETTGRYQDKDVHLIGVETTVLVQTGDDWQIQHVHWSSRKAH
ncbi:nuclear transport factor 2 family protein [Permianibacter sp. IMCC34836]|uniref:YybH family protein n=1 Tax=Permianibacter fluminis TaxID=2738515 RepID=UPI001553496C|nr:nuclear transport factor 2 family protein [Permianibacter fluminis]NQD36961.1 nuclear transport factor 2 family protein [Permianibacter fluminis]